MFDKVLVPLDGSELAERSLDPALAIVARPGGELILLNVPVYRTMVGPGASGYSVTIPSQALDLMSRDETEAYLERIRQTRASSGLAIKIEVLDGDVAGNIVDLAAEQEVDLIVMTTHGYSGFTYWMLGSITERVLRNAPCPVLAVRCADSPTHTLITLDGSGLAEQALSPGLEIARLFGARVTLLRVDEEARFSAIEKGMLDIASLGLGKQVEIDVDAHYLEKVAERYRSPKQPIDTVVMAGSPAKSILDFVKSNQVDLIVMATHGRSGIRRWVYGSVTEKCLHNTACAMLIVRPPVANDEPLHT